MGVMPRRPFDRSVESSNSWGTICPSANVTTARWSPRSRSAGARSTAPQKPAKPAARKTTRKKFTWIPGNRRTVSLTPM
jgi:hypothetical protein